MWEIAIAALGHRHDEAFGETQIVAPVATHGLNAEIDRFLLAKGLRLTEAAREAVIHEVRRALSDAFENRRRNAGGDYSPDAKASRFPPPWQPREETAQTPRETANRAEVPLTGLIDIWRKHPGQEHIAQSTVASYRYTVEALATFLKQSRLPAHNDIRQLTPQMIQAFTEHRMQSGIKTKTVRDSDLSCLKALFGFAATKGILPSNPAEGIKIKIRQAPQARQRKGFTLAEAQAILNHACNNWNCGSRESFKLKAAKRWVPWLCAYTGTRVGEMAQLRKQDIKQEDGFWIITIAHEAATQKRKATWDIPIHPHLIEMGFVEFVQTSEEGHLFLTPRPDRFRPDSPESRTKDSRGIMGPLQGVKNRLREFAREVVSAPDVQPSHGWRHRFKTVGRECGVEKVVLDAFALHEGESVSDGYGEVTIKTMLGALMKMPRYNVP
jgi:integrase